MKAEFQGMKMGPGIPPAQGPFEVEIVEYPKRSGLPTFGAVVLPTRQRFIDISSATLETCQDAVEQKFTKRLTEWTA